MPLHKVPAIILAVICCNLCLVRGGFMSGLKKFSPKKIVESVKDKAPDVVHAVKEQSPSSIVSNAVSGNGLAADAQEAAKTVRSGNGLAADAAEAAKTVSGVDKDNLTKTIGGVDKENALSTASQKAAGVATAVTAADAQGAADAMKGSAKAVLPEGSVATAPPTTTLVVDTTTDASQESEDGPDDVVLDKALQQTLDPASIERANTELRKIKERLQNGGKDIEVKVPTPEEVKHAIEKSTSNSKVAEAIAKARPGLDWVQDALKHTGNSGDIVKEAIKANSPKLSEAVRNANPNDLQRIGADIDNVSKTAKSVDDLESAGSNWARSVGAFVVAGCIVLALYQLVMRLKGQDSRSPTLLVESEMNHWMASGSNSRKIQQPGQEEPLFTQF